MKGMKRGVKLKSGSSDVLFPRSWLAERDGCPHPLFFFSLLLQAWDINTQGKNTMFDRLFLFLSSPLSPFGKIEREGIREGFNRINSTLCIPSHYCLEDYTWDKLNLHLAYFLKEKENVYP